MNSTFRKLRIAVAGGTGVIGRHVVATVAASGHEAVTLSRAAGVDLTDARAVAGALEGCDAVIDVASVQTLSASASERFFRAVTENLLAAEIARGVGHHVALSIVGAAAAPYGYYAGKKVQEDLVSTSRVGWTILRATQFHEFAAQTVARAGFAGLVAVPTGRTQPVAAAEVAVELVELALGSPRGFAGEMGGPEERRLPDLARRYLAASGSRRPVLPIPLPGGMGRAMRDGTLLPGPRAELGTQTFEEWLATLKARA